MDKIKRRKNTCIIILCTFLLICSGFIYNDVYKIFAGGTGKVIKIGVFSDSYWEVQNGYSYQILNDAIDIFEEQNPGVKVEYVSGILKTDYSEWLSEQILDGNAPDIFFVLPEDFNNLAEVDVLKDISPLIEKDGTFVKEAFYSSAYEYGQYNGHQYALPYECAPKLMFVNKSILEKENLEMPSADWTWNDFYKICKDVTKDTDGNSTLDQFGTIGYTWKEAFESNGVQLFDEEGTSCYFTGEDVGEALSFIEQLNQLNEGYMISSKDFDLGKVAFQPMSFSAYRAYRPYPLSVKKYSGFEWECIPMPAGPNGDNISTLDTLRIAINKNTKNEKYAWEFMKMLTCDPQIQSEIFDYSEGVSVIKEVTESEQTLESLFGNSGESSSLNLKVLSDAVGNAVTAPEFRNYDDAMTEVDRAVKDIIDGDSNIIMKQSIWNREINKILNNNDW